MISKKDKLIIYLSICLVTRISIGIIFIYLSEDDRMSFFLTSWSLFLFLILLWRSSHVLPWWLNEYGGIYFRYFFCTALFVLGTLALQVENYATIHKVAGGIILADVARGYVASNLHYKKR